MRGRLHLEVHDESRQRVGARDATNAVMRAGAGLLAALFAGSGNPITHMGVGTNDEPEPGDFSRTALANEAVGGTPPLTGATEVAIAAEAFTTEIDEPHRLVRVRVRATMPAAAAIGTVREAGLLSRTSDTEATLYNRVTFAPIVKGDDHELTMFWEVEFPYGDLQWLF
jgi:hypothetical protein